MTTPGQKIDVDLRDLRQTRDAIYDDADVGLKPGISDANGRIFRGLWIGDNSQSGEVDASRRALADAMDSFWSNSHAHIERAQQVIAFLDGVLADYSRVEDLAKLDVDAVLERFSKALPPEPRSRAQAEVPVRGDVQ